MHKIHLLKSATFLILILLLQTGCRKMAINEKPTVHILEPQLNLILQRDTTLVIIAEPHDADGSIIKIEFYMNDILVKTINSAPYLIDVQFSIKTHAGKYNIKVVAYDNNGDTGEDVIQIEVLSYLTLWLGRYQGKLHQWSSYPRVVDGHTIIATDHSYGKVTIDVVKSTQDSCLDLKGYYNDTIPFNHFGLKFSNNGTHFSSSGGGSTYSSLNIKFELDTLNYASFQKCGIPRSQSTDFKISKN